MPRAAFNPLVSSLRSGRDGSRFVSALFGTLLLVLVGFGADARASTTLKIGTLAPQDSPWGKKFKRWAKDVSADTNAELNLDFQWNGQAGDEVLMVQKNPDRSARRRRGHGDRARTDRRYGRVALPDARALRKLGKARPCPRGDERRIRPAVREQRVHGPRMGGRQERSRR